MSHENCKRLAIGILREVYSRESLEDALTELDMVLLALIPISRFRRLWGRVVRLRVGDRFTLRFAEVLAQELNQRTLFEVFIAMRLGGLGGSCRKTN